MQSQSNELLVFLYFLTDFYTKNISTPTITNYTVFSRPMAFPKPIVIAQITLLIDWDSLSVK